MNDGALALAAALDVLHDRIERWADDYADTPEHRTEGRRIMVIVETFAATAGAWNDEQRARYLAALLGPTPEFSPAFRAGMAASDARAVRYEQIAFLDAHTRFDNLEERN